MILNMYICPRYNGHLFSWYRRQSVVFSSVCFIAVCEILHFREKKSTGMSFLKIPCRYDLYLSVYDSFFHHCYIICYSIGIKVRVTLGRGHSEKGSTDK